MSAPARAPSDRPQVEGARDERRLAAIMFTDMVGYSAMMQRDPTLTLELLDEHHTLLRPVIVSHGGREVKTIGDAFLVEFASAVEAVQCALEMQTVLGARNESATLERQISIRIGIHLGDVVVRDRDVYGDGVNIAARIEPLAPAGGICISEDVANQVRNRITAKLVRLGPGALKNITREVVVFRVDRPGFSGPIMLPRLKFALARKKRTWTFVKAGVFAALVFASSFVIARRYFAPPTRTTPLPVAFADTVNQTGDPALDGLSGMFITSLEQSRVVAPLTRSKMLDLLAQSGKRDVARIDASLARELGKAQSGAMALVTIRRDGAKYDLELELRDAGSGDRLVGLREKAETKETILPAIDRMSGQARERLREAADQVDASRVVLAEKTTRSVEAYRHYFAGTQELDRGRPRDARRDFERAIELDADFALAWYGLARLKHTWDAQDATFEIEKALALADRLPPKERSQLELEATLIRGQRDRAIELADAAVRRDPTDKDAWFRLGDIHYHAGRFDMGLPSFERVLALDPDYEPGVSHAAFSKLRLGQRDDALKLVRRFADQTGGQRAQLMLANLHADRGELDEAYAAFEKADATSDPTHVGSRPGLEGMAFVRILQRNPAAARKLYESLLADPSKLSLALEGHKGIASTYVLVGKLRNAFESWDRAIAIAERMGDRAELTRLHALRAFLVGELRDDRSELGPALERSAKVGADDWAALFFELRARLVIGDAAKAVASGSSRIRAVHALVVEIDALKKAGRHADAAALLEQAVTSSDAPLGLFDLLATAHLEAGQPGPALAALGRLPLFRSQRTVEYARFWAFAEPRAALLEARALEASGDKAAALQRATALVELWKDADPDFSGARVARELRARLAH